MMAPSAKFFRRLLEPCTCGAVAGDFCMVTDNEDHIEGKMAAFICSARGNQGGA